MGKIQYRLLVLLAMLIFVASGCTNGAAKATPDQPQDMLQGIVTAKPADTPETLAEKKMQLERNLQSAKDAATQGQLDTAIAGLEEAVGFDPKHREVMLLLVRYSHQRSKELAQEDPAKSYRLIVQAGGYLRTFQESFKDLSDEEKTMLAGVLFDEACSHARSNRHEEFRGSFGAALSAGFADADQINNDPDIQALRAAPEIDQFVTSALADLAQRNK